MNAPIVVRFRTSPQLLYRAQVAVLRHIRWMRWGGVFVVGVFPLFMIGIHLAYGQSISSAIRNNLASIVGFPVFWLVGIPLLQRWGAARTYRTMPAARGDRAFTFDETGMVFEGGLSSGTVAWPAVVRAVETRDLFLLFLGGQAAHFIPKTAFGSPSDMQRFRELLTRKLPPQMARLDSLGA